MPFTLQDEAEDKLGNVFSNSYTANYLEAELQLRTDHIIELNNGCGVLIEQNHLQDYTLDTSQLRLGNTGNDNYVSLSSDPLLGISYDIKLPFTAPLHDDLLVWDGVSGRLKWTNDLVVDQLELTNLNVPGVSHQCGDIYVSTGTTLAHISVGVTSNHVLAVDFTEDICVKWKGLNQLQESVLFGSEFFFNEDETLESTTSDTYIERLSLDITGIVDGNYFVSWYYIIEFDTQHSGGDIRVQLNDTITLHESSRTNPDTGTDSRVPETGYDFIILAGGSHTIDIDYTRVTSSNKAIQLSNVRLIFWRIK